MNNYYYDIEDDLKSYPDAVFFFAIGGRNAGKTYSTLKHCYINKIPFVFLKRTMEDVDLLCAGTGSIGSKNKNEFGVDLSPFKSINRDLGSNVKAYSIKKGLGAFYSHNEEGEPSGLPIGYLMALNAVTKYKGFDLSECDMIIFDEFIPNIYDRINRNEHTQLLDFIKTVSRDREHRGRYPLKCVLLANATSISNPILNGMEITDIVAEMQVKKREYTYLEKRGILIHLIKDNPEFEAVEKSSMLYAAMGDTAWGRTTFENEFGYNDFSAIDFTSLKGYKPVCRFAFQHKMYYIYRNQGKYYCTFSKHEGNKVYDLAKENDQKRFFYDYIIDFQDASIEGKFVFESYTMYDIIMNYKTFFKI